MVTVINFSVNSAPKKSRVVFFLECDVTKEKSFGIENTRILVAADTSSSFTVLDKPYTIVRTNND